MTWLYGMLLLIAYSAPSLLTLSSYTYPIMTLAHFVTFLVSVILFVIMGKSLKKRHRPRFSNGLMIGAIVALAGTAIGQVIRRTPMAEKAFLAQVPRVPRQAALTMLHLHATANAVLSGIIFAVLFGLLGAVATWWGGRDRRRPLTPQDPTPETG
ncbi:MAG: hypothetical protein M1272_02600 [Firmicutes bacterium]|nr:hypothetical protein [Bacillota bacterium]